MKKITFLLPAMICLASCIRKEALNSEADILACKVEQEILKREPVISNDHVALMVKGHADLVRQSPDFVLSPGATIAPPGGTALDFRNPHVCRHVRRPPVEQDLYRFFHQGGIALRLSF